MPWLSIIMALVTFFLSGGSKKENRAKAALAALGVGAGTYYLTHNTSWGARNLGALDGVDVTTNKDGTFNLVSGPSDVGTTLRPSTQTGSQAGTNGLWGSMGSWLTSPAGQVTTGVLGATALGMPKWLIWGGAALALYAVLK